MTTDSRRTRDALDICDRVLDAPESARAALIDEACGDDAGLRAAVHSVLGAITSADAALGETAADSFTAEQLVGRTLGGCRLVELLGEGGMGAVYLGERETDEFTQRVAVKVVRTRFLSKTLLERFNAERQILAGLNHPYIAGLIDGGTDDGVPYLVMEYIDGQPIDVALDAARVDLTGRIEMLRKVALAVHAAHQNLVVHRDIKPSNVIVTDDGIPKLLDFGIARLMRAEDDPGDGNTTLFGAPAMTPDYASPEQLLDDAVTTVSDVYSLGVLAYQVLVGVRPYQVERTSQGRMAETVARLAIPLPSRRLGLDDAQSKLDNIAQARATTPERLRRALAGDLDNILMKALAQRPADRYASVSAFSADLGRFLEGQPVEARASSLAYRARRFVSRHKVAVGFSLALFLSLTVGLVATGWSYLNAESARRDAARQFNQVREIARTMMFDVFDDLERVPGTTTARQRLADTAQQYLESLADESADPAVRLDAARGYARLYAVLNRQAVGGAADRERALDAWSRAAGILESLAATPDADADVWLVKGQLLSDRGASLITVDNDPEAAREFLSDAFAAFETAAGRGLDSLALAESRLLASERDAETYKWQQDYTGAQQAVAALLERSVAAREQWGDTASILKIEGDAQQLLGEAHYFLDDYDGALDAYGESIARYEQALQAGGDDSVISAALGVARWSRGNTYIDTERPERAAEDYAAAIDIVSVAVARDPADTSTARRLAILKGSRAMALVRMGDGEPAIALMLEVDDWFTSQARAEPDTPGAQRSLAVSHHMTGDIYHYAGEPQQACSWYRRTLDVWVDIEARFGISEFDAGQPDFVRELLANCD
ncbi:MAG: protein kinase [Pseudomonadota bacterium]